ncbi:putative DRAP deaminase [Aspergillus affinis]|uniref:putative DRAP deaminase n=1 Tax=Aspergillus affinis TaxID=1070780 RepID=UPI0022FDE16E|nr:DRAP deaminase [Aspergillus affinis]KAI9035533.1 DRAP deaminase [Aspergillus affinis]
MSFTYHPCIAAGDHKGYMKYALEQARLSPPAPTKFCVGAVLVDAEKNEILSTRYSMELAGDRPDDPGNTHAEQCCLIKVAEQHHVPEDQLASADFRDNQRTDLILPAGCFLIMSHFPPDDTGFTPGPPRRPYSRRDDMDSRMYDDPSPSRSRSPGDPVTEVETTMIIGAGSRGHLRLDEGDQRTAIATEKAIALPDTTVEVEATVAVAVGAIDAAARTDKKVER